MVGMNLTIRPLADNITTMATKNWEPISTESAAEIIGCTSRHVRKLCETGQLRCRKIGARVWIVSRSDAERKARTVSATGRPRGGSV